MYTHVYIQNIPTQTESKLRENETPSEIKLQLSLALNNILFLFSIISW